jgi:hypothetical protein
LTSPIRVAWSFTGASLFLASLPAFIGYARSDRVTYDSNLAVLTATLIAIVWYTYYTYETLAFQRRRDDEERARSKKALASGVLVELKWIEDMLEQCYLYGPQSAYDPLAHPLLEAAMSQATLFSPKSVAAMAQFHGLMRDVRAGMAEYREHPERYTIEHSAKRTQFFDFMKGKSAFAINALPELVSALIEDGGTALQRTDADLATHITLPSLTRSPFGKRRFAP